MKIGVRFVWMAVSSCVVISARRCSIRIVIFPISVRYRTKVKLGNVCCASIWPNCHWVRIHLFFIYVPIIQLNVTYRNGRSNRRKKTIRFVGKWIENYSTLVPGTVLSVRTELVNPWIGTTHQYCLLWNCLPVSFFFFFTYEILILLILFCRQTNVIGNDSNAFGQHKQHTLQRCDFLCQRCSSNI